jgi:hypothetical protein
MKMIRGVDSSESESCVWGSYKLARGTSAKKVQRYKRSVDNKNAKLNIQLVLTAKHSGW